MDSQKTEQSCMVEWSFVSEKVYSDPHNDVELSVKFAGPDGKERVVPAFWNGGNTWRVRYASFKVGKHRFRTVCSDTFNSNLHGREGEVEVAPYMGKNPLLKHGPPRVSENRRHLEHPDGTPFFWLGDTWWMGLTTRLKWPGEFQLLADDRVAKGFTLIQIVAGLYPDMAPFDPRGANEAGYPWEEDYSRINPAYFDMADRRIDCLVQKGLVPCIVACWGYFLQFAGEETIKKHWRNLVARYGAYPVVWCVAGEAIMAYYLSPVRRDKAKLEEHIEKARKGWGNVTRYLRSIDPYHRPITIHPTDCAHNMVDDPSILDIDMLQTGHSGMQSFANTVEKVVDSFAREPRPVLVGEVCYEGILGSSWEDVQRLMFWTSILNGAGGHTYGANGIWQLNRPEKPFGPSPHGRSWGDTPWQEAYKLPGSRQVGLGKKLLTRYPWWRMEPHPEWAEPHWSRGNYLKAYAAGIRGELRLVYIPTQLRGVEKIKGMENGVSYHVFYFDPRTGREYEVGTAVGDEKGEWTPPNAPIVQDWVLVLENKAALGDQ